MTNLKDLIHEVIKEYEIDSQNQVADDFQALEMAIMDTIKDYFTRITS